MMETVFLYWCETFLTNGRAYRGSLPIGEPVCRVKDESADDIKRKGRLVYQDGTACSASHAFADVYLLDDGQYDVYMDTGSACYQGDCYAPVEIIKRCETIIDVTDFLNEFRQRDLNTTGELYKNIYEQFEKMGLEVPNCSFKKINNPIMVKAVIFGVLDCIRFQKHYKRRDE